MRLTSAIGATGSVESSAVSDVTAPLTVSSSEAVHPAKPNIMRTVATTTTR